MSRLKVAKHLPTQETQSSCILSLSLSLSLSPFVIMQHKSWIIIGTIYATLVQVCLTLDSISGDDKIVSLPGQPKVNFQQCGGYITIDERQHRALFYYFAEAETKPASKPLVLWLNGGKFTLIYLLNSASNPY